MNIVAFASEHPKAMIATVGALVVMNTTITGFTVIRGMHTTKALQDVNEKIDRLLEALDDDDDDNADE